MTKPLQEYWAIPVDNKTVLIPVDMSAGQAKDNMMNYGKSKVQRVVIVDHAKRELNMQLLDVTTLVEDIKDLL